ncbi:ZIP zinc/iron transport family [Rhizodiscina lignyota]|uniref:ZIP zinc/iron transport family n=1 Tax=Rhizodiscina lignyota TaxID=1504668 RepID=A0A9P4M9U9_9PEZI|nr:ZIP zinc/iron transport family [Rhizodiscina lignyota]
MATLTELASLVVRQSAEDAETTTVPIAGTPGHCDGGNDFNGELGVRISAIFVILIGSIMGAAFPTFARRRSGINIPEWAFFVAKFFGSGVIVATAFIHLLAPANDALTDPCLTGPITSYDWVEGIALMTVFSLFFAEIMTMRYANFGEHPHSHDAEAAPVEMLNRARNEPTQDSLEADKIGNGSMEEEQSHAPGTDHLGHARNHTDNEQVADDWQEKTGGLDPESYAAQMTAIFILEFGVIFHSIFIGLTLAVSGSEFHTLYVVLVFHQTFEGLGLGSRLASAPWPRNRRWTPYALAIAYGLSTPIAIAIGLGVRKTYLPGSATALIVNGVFDSISAGILIYTGLVELMAHEFMFSPTMQKAKVQTVLSAFFLMCLGAGLMALLGKWA